MATGVPASNQTIDFENLKWLVANAYLRWWGINFGPDPSTYPNSLVLNWEDIEFWIGLGGVNGGDNNRLPDWAAVQAFYQAAQQIVLTGGGDTEGGRLPLSWNDLTGEEGYQVIVDGVVVTTRAANVTTYDYPGAEDTTYSVKIRGYKTRTNRWFDTLTETLYADSNTISATTRLNAPSGVSATGQNTAVKIDFTQNSAVGTATHYEIYRRTGTNPFALVATVGISATGPHSYTDGGLSNGTLYDYYVRVVKKDIGGTVLNWSAPSGTVSAYAGGGGAQQAPTSMSGSVSGGFVSLSWDGYIGSGSAYIFRVERMDLVDGTWEPFVTQTGNSSGDFLNSGQCCMYRVRMEVAADGSDPSAWVSNGSFLCG